ncbi:alpha/beta fold hydrolase [Parabacteroides sp. FAFU027]|uniref:alpha/beta fold hydrolase n=1 Tax=Parabacteroides sp. FAFU027 TaxID=2922715 RepID=UPI001FAFD399|nr:alpha/beta fold hydrolase [Parabacteroides sp. FAFU027]
MKRIILFTFILSMATVLTAQHFPDSQKDGKYYTVNGAKLWTVSFGKGKSLFIIAGGPGYAHFGLRTLDSLSLDNTLVYYDAFGRGKSDTAQNLSEYTLKRDIDDLEGLRKAMGFKKINILGHSYGSVVAQGYALRYPENVNHLILISPLHSNAMWQENNDNCNREIKINYPEVWDTLMIIRKQGYKSTSPLYQRLCERIPLGFLYAYNPENLNILAQLKYPNRLNPRIYYQMTGEDGDFTVGSDIGRFDYRNELKNLKMPVLIIAGRFDRVSVPWMMVQYKEYCPQAQLVMFEKSGHFPFLEEYDKTMAVIRAFLKK